MVEYRTEELKLDLVFHALADSTRRDILERLRNKESYVTELASNYEVSLNAISKHLKVLEKANLIERTVLGRSHLCRANSEQLKEIEQWMKPYKKFWKNSLDNLEAYLQPKKGE